MGTSLIKNKIGLCLVAVLILCGLQSADASVGMDIQGRLTSLQSFLEVIQQASLRYGGPGPNDRALLPGAARLPFGVQIHPLCFRPNVSSLSRNQLTEELTDIIASAVVGMMNCQNHYAELTSYIDEWMSQLRNVVIVCTTHPGAADGFHALTSQSLRSALNREEIPLLDGVETSDDKQRPVIVIHQRLLAVFESQRSLRLTAPLLNTALDSGHSLRKVITHEIFHTTKVNNRHDHNTIETIAPGAAGACNADISIDRVSVITELCSPGSSLTSEPTTSQLTSNVHLNTNNLPIQLALSNRIQACQSIDRGCVFTFTSAGSSFSNEDRRFSRSLDLDPATALRLCRKIQNDGHCLSQRRRYQDESLAWLHRIADPRRSDQIFSLLNRDISDPMPEDLFLRHEPRLEEFAPHLRHRFTEILPRAENQIPWQVLRIWPEIYAKVLNLRQDSCAASILHINQNGLFLTPYALSFLPGAAPRPRGILNPELHFLPHRSFFSTVAMMRQESVGPTPLGLHFSRFASTLDAAVTGTVRCQNSPEMREAVPAFAQLTHHIASASSFTVLLNAQRRSLGLAELNMDPVRFYYSSFTALGTVFSERELYGRQLLGEPLFAEYLQALDLYHPQSIHYQCAPGPE